MPSNEKSSVIRRQWELLKLLPSAGTGKSAIELTRLLNDAGYPISKRQVERDLNDLREAFLLEHDEQGSPRGWRWPKGASANLPAMTLSEALSLRLVEDTLKSLMPVSMLDGLDSRFKQARNDLAKLSKENRKAKWASKIRVVSPTMPLIPPKIDPSVLTIVQEALLADEQIEVVYQSVSAEKPKTIDLSPLALVVRGPVSYLVATAYEYEDPWLFAMHRISKATRSVRPVNRPADFSLDEYIKKGELHFGNGDEVKMTAWVKPFLAKILSESPLSEDQKLTDVGERVKLVATVADTWQLHWWLMSHGANIEVVAPAALRKKISGMLKDASAQYIKMPVAK
jgi:predicted DNA-binding transcriptional regulator YafY